MSLSIHPCYFSDNQNAWDKNILAFDPAKNELTTCLSPREGLIFDLTEIARYVNQLSKPVFDKIRPFYNCFKNMERINECIKQRGLSSKIDLDPFLKNFKPSAQELKDKIWAVHVTDYIWPDTIMRPFMNILGRHERASGLNYTVHFALGETVRAHSKIMTWKFRPYAVITPVKDLMDQMVGINPYDTIVHGDVNISPQSILVVPENTVVPDIYHQKNIQVITYNPKVTSLRKAVKNQIKNQEGIHIKMIRNWSQTAHAYLFGDKKININKFEFFGSLFKEKKELNFGLDCTSLNNSKGFLFGYIRQISNQMTKAKFGSMVCIHALYFQYIYNNLKDKLNPLEQKEMEEFLSQFSSKTNPLESGISIDMLSNLNYQAFEEFKLQYPQLFPVEMKYDFVYACWAVKRWLMVGKEQGEKEKLEEIYKQNLSTFLNVPVSQWWNGGCLLSFICKNLETQSDRADLALYILNLEVTRLYNNVVQTQLPNKETDIFLNGYSTESIEAALASHSDIYILFNNKLAESYLMELINYQKNPEKYDPNDLKTEALELFTKVRPIKLENDLKVIKGSYVNSRDAIDFLLNYIPAINQLTKEFYETKIKDLEKLDESSLWYWKSTHGIHCYWRKLGLENQFTKRFANENDFWNSDKIFVEIYRELKKWPG
jgi:hypothetical protein